VDDVQIPHFDREACPRYTLSRQNPDGGFCLYRSWGVEVYAQAAPVEDQGESDHDCADPYGEDMQDDQDQCNQEARARVDERPAAGLRGPGVGFGTDRHPDRQ